MKKVGVIVGFLIGAAVGSGITAYFLNKRHRQEIASVKAVFGKYSPEKPEEQPEPEIIPDDEVPNYRSPELKQAREEYKSRTQSEYVDYGSMYPMPETDQTGEEVSDQPLICVISPDEIGEDPDYKTICLVYFADGVLAEHTMEIVDNPDFHVGSDFENHFGDYEEDAVHIRNDKTKCYYEILKDERTYAEAALEQPGQIDY